MITDKTVEIRRYSSTSGKTNGRGTKHKKKNQRISSIDSGGWRTVEDTLGEKWPDFHLSR